MLTISIIVSICKGTTFLSRFQVFSFEGSVKICKQKYGLRRLRRLGECCVVRIIVEKLHDFL